MNPEAPRRAAPTSVAVVEAVAASEGVDPTGLEHPLFDTVDPDALDRLVRSVADGPGCSPCHVTFPYHGYEVVASSDGSVELQRRADAQSR